MMGICYITAYQMPVLAVTLKGYIIHHDSFLCFDYQVFKVLLTNIHD